MSSGLDLTESRKRLFAASQKRQNKPLIEKRRRARINECLLQLQQLLMKDIGKESPRPSKLEKADILEMTVDYIKKMADMKQAISERDSESKTHAPFVAGVSRCLEEVDTFLQNQLEIQQEVRQKLASHCRQQLCNRDVIYESAAKASPLEASSQSADDAGVEGVNQTDTSTDTDDQKETLLEKLSEPDDVKPTLNPAHAPSAVSTTAYVAPFHYSTSPSAPEPGAAVQENEKSWQEDGGIRVAGALKLICGGNVFIVVDSQTINKTPLAHARPATNTTANTTGSHFLYNPVSLLNPAPLAYPPPAPHLLLEPPLGLQPAHGTCTPAAGSLASFPVDQSAVHLPQGLSPPGQLSPPDQLSPHGQRWSGASCSTASDVNNNDIMNVQHSLTAMWRPW